MCEGSSPRVPASLSWSTQPSSPYSRRCGRWGGDSVLCARAQPFPGHQRHIQNLLALGRKDPNWVRLQGCQGWACTWFSCWLLAATAPICGRPFPHPHGWYDVLGSPLGLALCPRAAAAPWAPSPTEREQHPGVGLGRQTPALTTLSLLGLPGWAVVRDERVGLCMCLSVCS